MVTMRLLQAQEDRFAFGCSECDNGEWECSDEDGDHDSAPPTFDVDGTSSERCPHDENAEYTSCLDGCPRTCDNINAETTCDTVSCTPGCRCKSGFVLEKATNSCISESQCGCKHGGKTYQHVQRRSLGVRKRPVSWSVHSLGKSPTSALSTGASSTSAETASSCWPKEDWTRTPTSRCSFQGVPCATGDTICKRTTKIVLRGEEVMTLGGVKPLPAVRFGAGHIVRETTLQATVFTNMGLVIQWDKATRLSIILQPAWKGRVKGLCGNFDGNQMDDFQTPSGGMSEGDARVFGDSWKLREACPATKEPEDVCEQKPHRKTWAVQKCEVLKSPLFEPCHSEVSLEPYYERCVQDVCGCDSGGDCECLCTNIAAYAHECAAQGVPVKWRSQTLCPIQCDTECSEYDACMPGCPPKTCETLSVSGRLEELCGNGTTCQEGCRPKPCPPGYVFDNERDMNCVREAHCKVPCKEIYGKLYLEGERIADERIAEPCESCFCQGGSIVCKGHPCPNTETPPTIDCSSSGWTPWLNPPAKASGDFALLGDPKFASLYSGYCGPRSVVDIECRVTPSGVAAMKAGQSVTCELPRGLACYHRDQAEGTCLDYEVRLLCDCDSSDNGITTTATTTTDRSRIGGGSSETTTATFTHYMNDKQTTSVDDGGRGQRPTEAPSVLCVPHWTDFYNTDSPDIGDGDVEALEDIRKDYAVCDGGPIGDVECKATVGGKFVDYRETEDVGVKCSKDTGLVCLNWLQSKGKVCKDYAVRFFCQCGNTQQGMTTTAIVPSREPGDGTETGTSGGAACIPGWSPFFDFDNPSSGEGDIESPDDYAEKSCSTDNVKKIECKVINDEMGTVMDWTQTGDSYVTCSKEQGLECLNDYQEPGKNCHNYKIRVFCDCPGNVTPTSTTGYPELEDTSAPSGMTRDTEFSEPTEPEPRDQGDRPMCGWTEWMDVDDPMASTRDMGDFESPDVLRSRHGSCVLPNLKDIECRVKFTHEDWKQSGQSSLSCDVRNGFRCYNKFQLNSRCFDYEVRLLCACSESENTTTAMPPSTIVQEEKTVNTEPEGSTSPTTSTDSQETAPACAWYDVVCKTRLKGTTTTEEPPSSTSESSTFPPITETEPQKTTPSSELEETATPDQGVAITDSQETAPTCAWYDVVCKTRLKGTTTTEEPPSSTSESSTFPPITETEPQKTTPSSELEETATPDQGVAITEVTSSSNGPDGFTAPTESTTKRGEPTPAVYTPTRPDGFYGEVTTRPNERNGVTTPTQSPTERDGYTTPYSAVHTTTGRDEFHGACPPGQVYSSCAYQCNQTCNLFRIQLYRQRKCIEEDDCLPGCRPASVCERPKVWHDYVTCIEEEDCSCMYQGKIIGCDTECSEYDACMPGCPPKTCETLSVSGRLEELCGNGTTCQEGCRPKPCPPGYVFDNERDMNCVREAHCKVPCKEIYGKLYLEGERIADERIAEPCESCFCQGGSIVCKGHPCPNTETPPTIDCSSSGWTPWLNPPAKASGDFALLGDPKFASLYSGYCGPRSVVDIECRVTPSGVAAMKAGQSVTCELPRGLACYHRDQTEGTCLDYEVRLLCDCDSSDNGITTTATTTTDRSRIGGGSSETTTATFTHYMNDKQTTSVDDGGRGQRPTEAPSVLCVPHWTDFYNTDSPDIGDGDVEALEDIRKDYAVCDGGPIGDVECKATVGGKFVDYRETEDVGVKCSKDTGLVCLNWLQSKGKVCKDYAVRFFCQCVPSREPGDGTETGTSGGAACIPGWSPFFDFDNPSSGEGDIESPDDYAEKSCSTDNVKKIECKVINDEMGTVMDWTQTGDSYVTCSKEQGLECLNDYQEPGKNCHNYKIRVFCDCPGNVTPTSTTGYPELEDTSAPSGMTRDTEFSEPTEPEPRDQGDRPMCGWTEWMDVDDPMASTRDMGDFESPDVLRSRHGSCVLPNLKDIECRVKFTHEDWKQSGQSSLSCDVRNGFRCYNKFQLNSRCFDYEVRLLCACSESENTTTAMPPSTIVQEEKTVNTEPEGSTSPTTSTDSQETAPACAWYDVVCKTRLKGTTTTEEPPSSTSESSTFPPITETEPQKTTPSSELEETATPDQGVAITEVTSSSNGPDGFTAPTESTTERGEPTPAVYTPTRPDGFYGEVTTRPNERNGVTTPTQSPTERDGYTTPYSAVHTTTGRDEFHGACPPGQVYSSCAYQCNQTCNLFRIQLYRQRKCIEEDDCLPGCRPASVCERPKVWHDYVTCIEEEDCSCMYQGKIIGANQVVDEGCERCICQDNGVLCTDMPGCKTLPTGLPLLTVPGQDVPVIMENVTLPVTCVPGWTPWYNTRKPDEHGDFETVEAIRAKGHFVCDEPYRLDIQCRVAFERMAGIKSSVPRQEVVCDLKKGLFCSNDAQRNRRCLDHTVRFYCGCDSSRVTGTTPLSTDVPTEYAYDRTTTETSGEYSTPTDIVYNHTAVETTTEKCKRFVYLVNGPMPLPASNYKASSSASPASDPNHSRLGTTSTRTSLGAWIPRRQGPGEFVEVDLGRVQTLFGVTTQGRDRTHQWVTRYRVLVSTDGVHYAYIQGADGEVKDFLGNHDASGVVRQLFEPPVRARFVRLEPIAWNELIALRFDVLGCIDGIQNDEQTAVPPHVTETSPGTPETATSFVSLCPEIPENLRQFCPSCPQGHLCDGSTCVPESHCPCFQDEHLFHVNTIIKTRDCNTCTCSLNGHSKCARTVCRCTLVSIQDSHDVNPPFCFSTSA
ncbi:hemocytin [Ixodes scapularis]